MSALKRVVCWLRRRKLLGKPDTRSVVRFVDELHALGLRGGVPSGLETELLVIAPGPRSRHSELAERRDASGTAVLHSQR